MISIRTLLGLSLLTLASSANSNQTNLTAFTALNSQINPIPALSAGNTNEGEESSLSTRSPAPPLTELYIYAIGSSNCDWESTLNLSTTKCDHGGSQLRAAVLEIGYGSNSIAWMAGGILPSSAMYGSTPVCVINGYYDWPCLPGQTVVGFLNEYTLDGHQNGIFKYQNTSTNSPWNTMTKQISIL
jgi:hypothetical protein